MNYRSVTVTARGGPEVLQVVERTLRPPSPEQVRVMVLATPVCLPDVQARYGQTPIAPKVPFVPGYAVVGQVDAVGDKVSGLVVGDRVAALTVSGGYAEYAYVEAGLLVPVPAGLDPAEVAVLMLNYIVAYQTMHRSAKVKAGDKLLIIGASGGVGTACLDLGRAAGLVLYGIASKPKHGVVASYGATAIDYKAADFVGVLREAEPGGLDAVLDGMGGDYVSRGYSLLRKGGTWVQYGNPLSFRGLVQALSRLVVLNLKPGGRAFRLYGTTTSKFGRGPFLEDWPKLFNLLEARKIEPVIMRRLPILQAAQANEILESGVVKGNIVLVNPELL